ncbi:hypothetical protein PR202_ga14044 [Eleusine coracana subsp. coracana]|uniref:Cleavage inducing molecular chaperone Jiv domain-containing protein n=1 Tax=Eleusine coracana subsp. coracana TaxID=191504 RepID=A0AAV5CG21_ELECO|nr:hypothetical protein PR202_ga14044 [Eleusine coracana subsp. coracana]
MEEAALSNMGLDLQKVLMKDCNEFHQAKDGDGWVEQSFQPILFGMLHKPDLPHAYVCAESYIFDVTEWFSCQGMRCPANTHKPSFHINASMAKQSGKGKGSGVPSGTNMDGEDERGRVLRVASECCTIWHV